MPRVTVEKLTFVFPESMDAQKYDDWTHYRQVWILSPRSQKAVDVVAVETSASPVTTWMIEAKDFRIVTSPPDPSNLTGLPETVAAKVQDTLAGLADAADHATVPTERALAEQAKTATKRRIVLHLEPHTGPHTALFPMRFAADVLQRLRQMPQVRAIDSNPLVLSIATTPRSGVPWTVEHTPEALSGA